MKAREIYERLRLAFPDEMDRTSLHNATGRNLSTTDLSSALMQLDHAKLATSRKEPTCGAPRELWRAVTNLTN